MESDVFLGVDVGSGSVRAVALDEKGVLLASAVEKLETSHPRQDFFEQSSDQIWDATCAALRRVIGELGPDGRRVRSVGFDATCSLVCLDQEGRPLSISTEDSKHDSRVWNIMMWMDHRAIDQAARINATQFERLKYVGRQMSPEMEPPKLLWLKENKPEVWETCGHFMDLADFLTFKASGSLARSQCTVVCKWLYEADASGGRWDEDFWSLIGLPELINTVKIGNVVCPPGTYCGILTPDTIAQIGLPSGMEIAVATGIIDAHAGVLGLLGSKTPDHPDLEKADVEEKLSIISGTSGCHMALSKEPGFVGGVWGPYYGVILDGYWLNEGGQNALGPVLDEVAMQGAEKSNSTLGESHMRIIDELQSCERQHGSLSTAALTKDLHVWPDYRGNRSPMTDPKSTGVIAGLRLKSDIDEVSIRSTTVTYLAHVQSLAYMTRYIMETISEQTGAHRKPFSVIYLCGGLQKNAVYVQTHADVCRVPVVVPSDSEVVARGAAILGAHASGTFSSVSSAIHGLSCYGTVVMPRPETYEYHDKKYRAFRLLGKTEAEIRHVMSGMDK